jgi:hypothetical protein
MAKFTALSRSPVVIAMPRRSRARRAVRYVGRGARRIGRGARRALPTVGIALGGAVAGYLKGSGRLDFLPEIGGSKMVALGLVGWGATRFSRNPHIRAAGIAALAAAAFDFGEQQGGGGTHGDDSWGWRD